MNAILTALIAVLGTLLGSTVTHVFQQRAADRTGRSARQERLRQEQLTAYGAFAGLLVRFRRALMHHWFCVHEQEDADLEAELRHRSFELRSETQHALFQLQLITHDPALVELAARVFHQVGKIDRAPDRADVVRRRDETQALIDEFVTAARAQVQLTLAAGAAD
ncbi:hypothetical protein [Kitasatospora sp. NBC_01266]|uniref:hypothetical protein n=1 Tax=Kitasatospora sp. NBC_01266 TaxID=2903572 RepID=UPI002E34535D|nr:hypothetical protein [Kitasatospora sp. NBC_01266]